MPVLGLVLVLQDAHTSTLREVEARLQHEGDVELGTPSQHRWPVVLESPSPSEAEASIASLRSLPGISGVDVVYADFEDLLGPLASADVREEV